MSACESTLERWLKKALNGPVIKGNLPPFTLTGDFNDAVFPINWTNKIPWWTARTNLYYFDYSPPEFNYSPPKFDLISPKLTIGSWCNYDEAHHYYQKFIDRDMHFREERQNSEQASPDVITLRSYFKTSIKRGTIAWDITENRKVLEEYDGRKDGTIRRPLYKKHPSLQRWMHRSIQLISDLKDGKINMKSNEVQGRIGKELKTKEEIRIRNELDNPNNEIWTRKRVEEWRRNFIELKITNTIEWQKFCTKQASKE